MQHPEQFAEKQLVSWLVSALTLIAAAALLIPQRFALGLAIFLPLHTAMEFFSVVVALLVFTVGINSHKEKISVNQALLSSAFLIVGLLDFGHTLSYAGMPDFVTASGPEKAIHFWLAARLTAALALLAVAVLPWQKEMAARTQVAFLAAGLAFSGAIYWIILFHQDALPHVFDAATGLTPLKRGMEYLLVGMYAATAIIFYRRKQEPQPYDVSLLFAAVAAMGLGELFFAAYAEVTDLPSLLGHIYKIIAYYLLYRAIFAHGIRAPFLRLIESEHSLRESEERYRLIIETSAEGIWLIDQHYTIVFANQKMAEMLGYSGAAQLIGRSVLDFTDEQDLGMAANYMARRSQGISEQHEFKFRRRDGSELWANLSSSPIFQHGEYLGALAMVSDITERKLAAQKIAALQYRNELILNNIGDGICGLDGDGLIHFINPAAAAMLGYRAEELLGLPLHAISHHTRADGTPYPARECPILGSLKNGSHSHESSEVFWRRDGSSFPAEYSCTPVLESSDENIRVVVIFSDITTRKQAEEALRHSEARFRTIFDSVDDAIFVHNLDSGAIVDVNRRASEIYGYTREELLNCEVEALSSCQPPYTQENALRWIAQASSGKAQNFEWQAKTREGRLFWVEINMQRTAIAGKEKLLVTVRDISERKHAADVIADLYNNAPNGYHSLDPQGMIAHINDTELAWLGYRRDEVVGRMNFSQLITESNQKIFHDNYLVFKERGYISDLDYEMLRKDGSTFPVLISATAVRDQAGRYLMSRSVVLDMTARRQAEKKLRDGEERYRTLFGSIQDAIFVFPIQAGGMPGKFVEINEVTCRMLGYSRAELLEMTIADVDAHDAGVDPAPLIKRLLAGESVVFEQVLVTQSGKRIAVEVNASPFKLAGQAVIMALVRDITERKQMAQEAGEAHQRLRQLSAHLLTVREEEKASIAREIHDDLGGTLTALKMDAYWLARKLPTNEEAAPLQERIESMLLLLDSAVSVTRRIITELRPSVLDDLGLLAALEWQAAQFHKRTGIECRVDCIEDKDQLDKQHAIALFRIFQEALTNVTRHSGATRVEVQFHHGDKAVSLLVHDNGRGLGENVDTTNRYGIRGMFERASALGGYARIESPPDGGLTVNVIFPLQNSTIEETP